MTFRKLFVAASIVVPLALEVACSGGDDTKTVYIVPEGGTTRPDDGGVFCEPAVVPEPTFDAPATSQKLCTDADIKAVIDGCASDKATKPACDGVRTRLAACAACIIGKETDPVAHPGYQYSDDTIAIASPSACMLAVAKNDEEKKCAVAYGQFETCSLASCLPPCLDDTRDHFESCLTAALNSTCTKGTDVIVSDSCKTKYNDATYGFCTSNKDSNGKDLSDPDYFAAVAKIICGGLEPADAGNEDSGIKDAGSDG